MASLLIVEDNAGMRSLLRSVVADLFETVAECDDGARALAAYRGCRPDWVFMDIRMSGLDGIAATARIKDAFPEARVVIVTDYDDAQLRRAARDAGACAYVLKDDLLELRGVVG
ncbi:MAG TPA: response regulator transcription factor [Pyrinomonadaceae bacterium]|nr:response regulator transcription factor [Pyrinomonadaceae bacterium]